MSDRYWFMAPAHSDVDPFAQHAALVHDDKRTEDFESVTGKRGRSELRLAADDAQPGGTEAEISSRELEVLHLVADGLTDAEIGRALFVTAHTTTSHVRHIIAKLQARSRAHAVAIAFRCGILP